MTHRQRLEEIWVALDRGRVDVMQNYFAADYVRHSDEGDLSREGFAEGLAALHAGFPDLESAIEDVISGPDRAAWRWSARGTHDGIYMGVPPTHRRVAFSGITISRFDARGLICEDWASWNRVTVLHRMGILPLDIA
jgi:predicted ester cyclase